MTKIPVYKPSLTGNEKKYVDDCLDSTWISAKGKYNEMFSAALAEYLGGDYALTVCNGTLALHLALMALGIQRGDEVIVPSFTYIASANAVSYITGVEGVVFADSCEDTWQIDPEDIKKRISRKTKAIMAVHLYGHPCDMDEIRRIANEHGLFVIEDCAEAIGSEYKGKKVGVLGDIAAFSFFGNKTITCGEGGALVTGDRTLFERATHIASQGLAGHREYWHDIIGYNYRMTNIAAAIGYAQLEQIEDFISKKRAIAQMYKERLIDLPLSFHDGIGDVRHTYWMVSIRLMNKKHRDPLRIHLDKRGIETRPTFYPIHTMPVYDRRYQRLPKAEELGWSGINLPSYPSLNKDEVAYICDCIHEYFQEIDGE